MKKKQATLEDAIALAVTAHRGQEDKSGLPYILHPLRVMFRCGDETERLVAVLHDVVEDTPITLHDLREQGYSEEVVVAVDAITQRKGESKDDYLQRVVQHPIARRVKLADLEDNMDVRRLPEVTERDQARLNRYIKAWRNLKAIDA